MNGTNSRRGFLKGFGLLSAVFAGGTAYNPSPTDSRGAVRSSSDAVRSTPVDQNLAPTTPHHLALVADNTPREAMRINSEGVMMYGSTTEQNRVAMSVGRDNRLWIKVDDQWRRVALEG